MERFRLALILSTGNRYFAMAANFVLIAIVSRLMSPDEIGVSVVGLAVISVALAAREFVSTNYLIQAQELSREDVRTAFTIMAIFTVIISVPILVFTPEIAEIYHDPRLVPFVRVVMLSFMIEIFYAPILTLFRRDMEFGKVAAIQMTSTTISLVLVIVLAVMGFGYMSFAWGWLADALGIAIMSLAARPDFWIFRPCLARWKTILTFGGYNGATVLLQKLYEQLPYLVLGRLLTMSHVAIFSRAIMLCQLPDRIITGGAGTVILSAFSAEVRKGKPLNEPYLKSLEIVSAIQWPALILLAIMAYPAVIIVFGDQWLEAVPLVRIIALAFMFSFGFELNYPILVSLGAMRDLFLRTLIAVPISIITMCAAALISLEAVAWSLLLIVPFQTAVSFCFIFRHIRVTWGEIGRSLQRSVIVTACSAAAALVTTYALPLGQGVDIVAILACGTSALAGWLAGIRITGHPIGNELQLAWQHLRAARRRFA